MAKPSAHRAPLLAAELCKVKALGWSQWGSWFNIWSKHKVLETSANGKPSILEVILENLASSLSSVSCGIVFRAL